MSRRVIQLEDRTILFSPDDPAPLAGRLQALLKMRMSDELTGAPPDNQLTIKVSERGFIPRVASGGIAGLVGIPGQVFPNLNAQDYFVRLTIQSEGYVARNEVVKVPQDITYPATFTPPQLDLKLHRDPVVISGRIIRFVSNSATPMAGAGVSVTGIWRTPPPSNAVVLADPPNLVSLQPPLYIDRAALAEFMRQRDLPPAGGPDKTLLDDTTPGDNPIRLSDRQGLTAGDILLIDAGQPDLAEFIAVKNVPLASPADQPTLITLDHPVIHAHRRDAIVKKVNPQPFGAQRQFTVNAIAGDTCVFLDALAGLAAAQEVQINGPPGPDEYHKLMRFSVTSDADGYYRLPPLGRVAQLEIHAEKIVGGQTFKATVIFRPDYRRRENRLDLTLAV
jgi:hypothetical protein